MCFLSCRIGVLAPPDARTTVRKHTDGTDVISYGNTRLEATVVE